MTNANRFTAVLALLGVLVAGPAAAADRFLAAEREAARGRLLVRIGKLADGVAALERAHALSPDPRYRIEVGKAYEEAGRLPEAVRAYERYLSDGEGDPKVFAAVRTHADDLRGRLAQTHGEVLLTVTPEATEVYLDAVEPGNRLDVPVRTWLPAGEHALLVQEPGYQATKLSFSVAAGAPPQTVELSLAPEQEDGTLLVRANRRDASVFIDGHERCKAPCEQSLQPGTYLVRVEAPGDAAIQQLVRIRPGQTVPVDAMLRAGGGRGDVPRIIVEDHPPDQPGDRPGDKPGGKPRIVIEQEPERPGRGPSALAIAGGAALGVGVAAAGVGGYFTYAAFDKGDQANGLDAGDADYQDRFDSLKGEVETNSTIAMAMYIGGGALAATGATLLIIDALSDKRGPETGKADVVPFSASPVPGGAMVHAQFRF